ncbi:MAG: phosphopantothenoylcysteine decarboxylase [bacterium]
MIVKKPLNTKTVLISAGPTREYLDPVRFISNESSGNMGYALASEARRLGAKVILISGPTNLKPPQGVRFVKVVSAGDMLKKVHQNIEQADFFLSSAAVADFAPKKFVRNKIRKRQFDYFLQLKPTADILKKLSSKKGKRIFVGFNLSDSIKNNSEAVKKLKEKQLDFIFSNSLKNLNNPKGSYILLDKKNNVERLTFMSKSMLAKKMFKFILKNI